ncbi:pre-mrna-splicing factor cwf18 [Holotrichia oblita]|uniref:Pre-mrna-splicing factor cwf18 n=1 Tax=Holotrichia oblita TaxID=644536 RepID=A0ACB9SVF2_HOLOL|nr:pre-mrna-splicing factor cwf18 [Holotrichia oblita]
MESSSLEEQAVKRKEKLKALKRKRDIETQPNGEGNKESIELPKPKFRSYKPEDELLNEHLRPETKLVNLNEEIQEQLESAQSKVVLEELDISNLAPRKPDWDLKRDVAKKLEKLERRTQKAIAELIRERLKQRQEDLATIVNAGTMENDKR